jgi:nitroimidazol reductase NimA-like FMN-containing flavoprotein (pyridoxamine 5'-phosphate oxidase superfamily)
MSAASRSRAQRRRDTERRLSHDVDVWVASASADGAPYLVPLSFDWDGEALLIATPTDSPTGTNLAATRTVRLLRRDGRWLVEAGEIEPGDADGDREGGPTQQMETQ